MQSIYPRGLRGLLLGAVVAAPLAAGAGQTLTLGEAERIALGDDPATLRYTELAAALQQAAIAAGQLPGPVLYWLWHRRRFPETVSN